MSLFGMWVLGACRSEPAPPVDISDCSDFDCQQAWVLDQYTADPRGVSEWIAAVADPIEQHALVSLVGEHWPGELKTTPPRACARGGGWFRFGGFGAAESLVAGKSPGREHRRV